MKTAEEYFEDFSIKLSKLNDIKFISEFNKSVGIKAFGVGRQGYLQAIRKELDRRNIDYSNIGNSEMISYKNKVFLKNKKLYLLFNENRADENNNYS